MRSEVPGLLYRTVLPERLAGRKLSEPLFALSSLQPVGTISKFDHHPAALELPLRSCLVAAIAADAARRELLPSGRATRRAPRIWNRAALLSSIRGADADRVVHINFDIAGRKSEERLSGLGVGLRG